MEVGIKQAKNELSKLVQVAQGTRVFLMNRGKRVAEIVPVERTTAPANRGLGMFKDEIHLPPGWGSQKHRELGQKEILDLMEGESD